MDETFEEAVKCEKCTRMSWTTANSEICSIMLKAKDDNREVQTLKNNKNR